MKIEMSSRAVTMRLKIVNQLRRTCLSLADSSEGRKIRKKYSANIYMAVGCQAKTSPIDRKEEKIIRPKK